MSNPLKAIGKAFKSVVKVVKKVALPALMIGAVVLTGGAALGVLPAVGSVLGSIGISGTLASVLGGAISMGAVGAVTGGLASAVSGGNILKGATGGFLAGAATGGVLGGLGVIGADTVGNGIGGLLGHGTASAATGAASNGLVLNDAALQAAGNAALPGASLGLGSTTAASGGVAAAASAAPAVAAGGGGLLSNPNLLMLGGQLLSGFASGKSTEAQLQAEQQALKDKFDRTAFNYGYRNVYGDPNSDVPTGMDQWYNYKTPSLQEPDFVTAYNAAHQTGGLLGGGYQMGLVPTTYEIINGQVVGRPQG